MQSFPIYLFIFIVFLNRYVFGWYLTILKGKRLDPKITGYEPTITIVVPLYNEGRSIYDTIKSLVELDYPSDKLEVTVVDDCSTDDSCAWACKAAAEFPNVRVLRNDVNMGKRKGINAAVRASRAELIVSVDSDVIVYPTALRELVARFTSPEIAAVGGRIHVSNPNENWLTRLQTIKYYFGQEHLKNLERALDQVMCLSGCLTAYRRSVLIELEPILEDRNIMGVPIKYGEDRYLTHQIVKHGYKTRMTMDAMCFTKAATNLRGYFNQQLRADGLKGVIRKEVERIVDLKTTHRLGGGGPPHVIMVVGVNGSGKTTTIGKLAAKATAEGKKVVLAAGDTFRAAAAEQLDVWAERAGAELVKGKDEADPASVIFDAVKKGIELKADLVIADTAGRLHTKLNLMEELKKVRRVIDKALPGAPHEVLLVLDSTNGQNAIAQARQFHDAVGITAIALTKLDGTAKGGVIIGICDELKVPVAWAGVGEKVQDLRPFEPKEFVEALFD